MPLPSPSRGLAALCLLVVAPVAEAITLDDPTFGVKRTWSAPAQLGVPASLGALLFSSDGTKLYAVGAAEDNVSAVYELPVTRDPLTREVTALGRQTRIVLSGRNPGSGGAGFDAGLEVGPAGTAFYEYFGDTNVLAERPGGLGGTAESTFGVADAAGAVFISGIAFSRVRIDSGTGFGFLQVTAQLTRIWEVPLTNSGGGVFTPGMARLFARLPVGELTGIHYIPGGCFKGRPIAGDLMHANIDSGELGIMRIDSATGLAIDSFSNRPVLGTSNPKDERFAAGLDDGTGIGGPMGLEFDPLTGDLFVGTFEGNPANTIVQIGSFVGDCSGGGTTTTTSTTTSTSTSTTSSTSISTSTSTSTSRSSSSTTSTPTSTSTSTTSSTLPRRCLLDVDGRGGADVSTDVVYIARRLLGLAPVPPSFRVIDPTIPPDGTIAASIDAVGAALDVDGRGGVDVSTDVVYIARRLLGLAPVPPSFRVIDPTIPSDATVGAAVDGLCP